MKKSLTETYNEIITEAHKINISASEFEMINNSGYKFSFEKYKDELFLEVSDPKENDIWNIILSKGETKKLLDWIQK